MQSFAINPVRGELQGCLQGLPGGCAELFAKFEALAAYRQQPAGRRLAAVDVGIDLEHRLRAHGVGGETGVPGCIDASQRAGRRRIDAGVDEEHAAAALQIERVLHLQLEIGQAFDLAPFRMARCEGGEMLDEQRPQRVVAAAGIAPAEDQGRRRQGRSRVRPR